MKTTRTYRGGFTSRQVSILPVILVASLLGAACVPAADKKSVARDTASDQAKTMDYSGVYIPENESPCALTITIRKKGAGYAYGISGSGMSNSGVVTVGEEDGQTYLSLAGTKCEKSNAPVSAMYDNGSLTIQNYGNAMNQYTCFPKCDAKYLRLIKQK